MLRVNLLSFLMTQPHVARATIYAIAFLTLVLCVIPALLHWSAPLPFSSSPALRTLGGTLFLSALAFTVFSLTSLIRSGKGTPAPFDPPRRLVRDGPYQYVRNPVYLGLVSVLLGEGLWLASGSVMLYAAIVAASSHVNLLCCEEPALHRRFGLEFSRYAQDVPRWMPRVR